MISDGEWGVEKEIEIEYELLLGKEDILNKLKDLFHETICIDPIGGPCSVNRMRTR